MNSTPPHLRRAAATAAWIGLAASLIGCASVTHPPNIPARGAATDDVAPPPLASPAPAEPAAKPVAAKETRARSKPNVTPSPTTEVERMVQRERLRRQDVLRQAELALESAAALQAAGDFEQAIRQYEKARGLAESITAPQSDKTEAPPARKPDGASIDRAKGKAPPRVAAQSAGRKAPRRENAVNGAVEETDGAASVLAARPRPRSELVEFSDIEHSARSLQERIIDGQSQTMKAILADAAPASPGLLGAPGSEPSAEDLDVPASPGPAPANTADHAEQTVPAADRDGLDKLLVGPPATAWEPSQPKSVSGGRAPIELTPIDPGNPAPEEKLAREVLREKLKVQEQTEKAKMAFDHAVQLQHGRAAQVNASTIEEPADIPSDSRAIGPGSQPPERELGTAPVPRDPASPPAEARAAAEPAGYDDFDFGDVDEVWILHRPGPADPARTEPAARADLLATDPKTKELIPLPLRRTKVRTDIAGILARTVVEQRFENPFEEKIEVTYVFPLPEDAAVTDFVMTIGSRRIRGVIRERGEAERIYAAARAQGYRAAILTQERPNIFTQNVANIEPGKRIDLSLTFHNTVAQRDGHYEFTLPLVVGPRFNPADIADPVLAAARGKVTTPGAVAVHYLAPTERSAHEVDLEVRLDAGLVLRELDSPSHVTHIERDGDARATIRLGATDRLPNRDFTLRYALAGDTTQVAFLRQGEHFVALVEPPAELTELPRQPRELVFVVDCSGSMEGEPLDQAKRAMRRCLRQLDPEDFFTVLRFSDEVSALGDGTLLPATPARIEQGLAYIDALRATGGTMMERGVQAAFAVPPQPGRLRLVTFMTDGYIGDEARILARVQAEIGEARVFSFGIGSSVNRYLIEGLARVGRGAAAYVALDEDPDWVVDCFHERIAHPACLSPEIDWNGLAVSQVYPQRLPDLLPGRPTLIVGKCEGELPKEIVLRGTAAGREVSHRVSLGPAAGGKHEGLPFVWARQRLRAMQDYALKNPSETLREAMIDFSVAHKVLCRETAFLAVDASERTEGEIGMHVPQAVPVPEGVSPGATVDDR